ncbi:lipase/acyltransferase domain-containing protein [Pigmentiphaga litoralis]|uniref:lipase/acyltransferase domain-containing protein n=1 Tax=Pigmentiphaga litoralis TaxID=516702 RepID=UPI00389B2DDD
MAEVIVFVPGIMGSELYLGDELIWPGTPAEMFLPYGKMEKLLRPDLLVGDIIRRVSVSNQYASLIKAFKLCGYDEETGPPTLIVCPYDWRKDNRLAADRLAECVKKLRADHGEDVVINIVAHSMGGLVSRYFLESGSYSAANCLGFERIQRLITIGTPHRGAPLALCAAMGQIRRLFLNAKQVKQIADRNDFPALYQLMPPRSEPYLWNTDPEARLEPAKVYEDDTAKLLGLNAANLKSAAAFHAALDTTKKPDAVVYFCFIGTRQDTICNVQGNFAVEKFHGAFSADALLPEGVEIADGGDGTVPSWSASIPGMQQLAVGGDHGGLYKTPEVLRTLGALLGKQGVLSSEFKPEGVRLSLRDEVVTPGFQEPVVLFFNIPTRNIDAEIVMTRCAGSDGQLLPAPAVTSKLPFRYIGAPIDSLALKVGTPDFAGVYEMDVQVDGASVAENKPRLLVQQE